MNTTQDNKLNMYGVTDSIIISHKSIWDKDPIFSASYNLWHAKIPLIEQNRDIQLSINKGITTEKSNFKKLMIKKAITISHRMQSYAFVVNNSELLENIKHSLSSLNAEKESDVVGICDIILENAIKYLQNLGDYGISSPIIDDFNLAINNYKLNIPNPKKAKGLVKIATKNLVTLFKEADDILYNRLDLDIEIFKETYPDFYKQYKDGRKINPLGIKAVSVKGLIHEVESKLGVKNVTITVESIPSKTPPSIPLNFKTGQKGFFRIKHLDEGTYKITIEKLGYITQIITITIIKTETTSINIALIKS